MDKNDLYDISVDWNRPPVVLKPVVYHPLYEDGKLIGLQTEFGEITCRGNEKQARALCREKGISMPEPVGFWKRLFG